MTESATMGWLVYAEFFVLTLLGTLAMGGLLIGAVHVLYKLTNTHALKKQRVRLQ